jgi:hypothetical protein
MERIKQIDGIEYNFKTGIDKKKIVGFSAQNIKSVP